jgi:hypothetical protein
VAALPSRCRQLGNINILSLSCCSKLSTGKY